jgi:hypothetical protein
MGVPGVKTFGMFWCPACAMSMEFISHDPSCKVANNAECIECEYVFGESVNELCPSSDGESYETIRVGVLSPEIQQRAIVAMAKERRMTYITSGIRLEDLRRKRG